MNQKYHVQLSETERKKIQELMTAVETPKGIRKHCNVLLQANENVGKSGTQEKLSVCCGVAPEGRSRWILRLLAEKVVELEIMDAVSHATIRSTLKKHSLSLT